MQNSCGAVRKCPHASRTARCICKWSCKCVRIYACASGSPCRRSKAVGRTAFLSNGAGRRSRRSRRAGPPSLIHGAHGRFPYVHAYRFTLTAVLTLKQVVSVSHPVHSSEKQQSPAASAGAHLVPPALAEVGRRWDQPSLGSTRRRDRGFRPLRLAPGVDANRVPVRRRAAAEQP